MELQYQGEAWYGEWPDLEFHHTTAIFKKDSEFYYGSYNRRESDSIDSTQLELTKIPDEYIYAAAPPDFLLAPDPLPSNIYIKTPVLLDYEDDPSPSYIHSLTLSEIRVCEILRHHPHPNIAQYLGCLEGDNRIRGICYVKYKMTLADYLREGNPIDVDHFLAGIEKAVSHLHSLKLVHGDLGPMNIMLNDNNEPILIDFDSCRLEGEELIKGGTPKWSDYDAKVASFANDEYSLEKIRKHLLEYTSGSPDSL
ncbi:serine/threonine kinase [Xylaria bambusicola]|uniref:serine/threonine kinase n=1 Tax=Xylaria bambusicola TaxID=326684 RepID=UPI0020075858|nr:serine/threonine kinase [Xylaria bambusicola]KAI0505436.1 serine/threonine kinase [Xylaria bambusicola]